MYYIFCLICQERVNSLALADTEDPTLIASNILGDTISLNYVLLKMHASSHFYQESSDDDSDGLSKDYFVLHSFQLQKIQEGAYSAKMQQFSKYDSFIKNTQQLTQTSR